MQEFNDRHQTVMLLGLIPVLYYYFPSIWMLFDLICLHFSPSSFSIMYLSWTPFWTSEVCRRKQERTRNLRKRFYRLVGRVRALRVPARRLGDLTGRASLDERKIPLGDHFGINTNV